jgi:hypothetical protein
VNWLRYTWLGICHTTRQQSLIFVLLLMSGMLAGGIVGFGVSVAVYGLLYLLGAHAYGREYVKRGTRRLMGVKRDSKAIRRREDLAQLIVNLENQTDAQTQKWTPRARKT